MFIYTVCLTSVWHDLLNWSGAIHVCLEITSHELSGMSCLGCMQIIRNLIYRSINYKRTVIFVFIFSWIMFLYWYATAFMGGFGGCEIQCSSGYRLVAGIEKRKDTHIHSKWQYRCLGIFGRSLNIIWFLWHCISNSGSMWQCFQNEGL